MQQTFRTIARQLKLGFCDLWPAQPPHEADVFFHPHSPFPPDLLAGGFRGLHVSRGKVILNRCLLDVRCGDASPPCRSDACREGALQRDTFVGHSQKGSLRNPSRLTPLPQKSAMQCRNKNKDLLDIWWK
jgi:hypothetical protein